MEEWFDVVDRNDCVIGRESRSQVHRLGLSHRAVHLLVYNRAGQIFLQKRSLLKDTAPGQWSTSCAGHVDAGEDYDTAVVREAAEELGLRLSAVPPQIGSLPAVPETGQEFVRIYQTESEGPFVLPPAEVEDGRWWSVAELETRLTGEPGIFATSFHYIWNCLREQCGPA